MEKKDLYASKYEDLNFVGIIEHIKEPPYIEYCLLNLKTGGKERHKNLKSLGESVALEFGEKFKEKITYEPPEEINKRIEKMGPPQKFYYKLFTLEKEKFEKYVLEELK
ncbi:MAG: hypothetical protein Q8Q04_00840 [archaeon]|nr:hypothetical protein [archaeon]